MVIVIYVKLLLQKSLLKCNKSSQETWLMLEKVIEKILKKQENKKNIDFSKYIKI